MKIEVDAVTAREKDSGRFGARDKLEGLGRVVV